MPNLTVNVEQQADKPLVKNVSLIQDGARVKIFYAGLTQRNIEILAFSGDLETESQTVELYLRNAGSGKIICATIAVRGTGWPDAETMTAAEVTKDYLYFFMWREKRGDDQPLLWSRASDGVAEEEVR
jgi:hypothetical protein